MMDCSSAGIRDLLPEYAHGRLAAAERVAVEAHVAGCADCAAELSLVRAVASALSAAPATDVARIVAALPAPPRRPVAGVIPIESRRSRDRRWGAPRRFAAIAAVLVAAVALSLAGRRGAMDEGARVAPVAPLSPIAVAPSETSGATVGAGAPAAAVPSGVVVARASNAELSVGGGVSDLSDDAIRSLLGDIERIDDAAVAEPVEALPAITGIDEEAGV